MSIKTMLNDEIRSEIEEVGNLQVGSDEHKTAIEALAKLLDKYVDMDKLDLEYQDKYSSHEDEMELKEKQFEDDKRDKRIKNILTGDSVIGGFALNI